MTSLATLQAQRDALNDTIADMQNAARKEAIAKAKAIMEAHGLTIADLRAGVPHKGRKPAPPAPE